MEDFSRSHSMMRVMPVEQQYEHAFLARYLEIHGAQARSARDELDRLCRLIDDASARLMGSFSAIQQLTQDGAMSEQFSSAVGSAISALQFQDMATQLAGHAARRIALLEKITEPLGRLPRATADELTAAVNATDCGRRGGPVEQACMTGGEVELF
jgi:hypothetical protein